METNKYVINFKEGVPQKTSSIYTKLGTIKNNFFEKLKPTNLDVKIRHFMEEAQIAGLTALNKGTDFINTKVANYYLAKEDKELERREQVRIEEEELARERAIEARTEEHKIGMKEALKEQARMERQQRMINFKAGLKQRTTSVFGKLGTIKNALVEKLKNAKDKVVDFASTKVANYYLEKEAKELERQEEAKLREEELAQEREIEARTEEHKIGMKEALMEQERLEREARVIKFRQDAKQMTRSIYAKLGTVKNDVLVKIMPTNLDVKIRNLLEEAQIAGLDALNNGKEYLETKIANYYLDKADKELERQEQQRIMEEELAREREIAARTAEHKVGMKEAFKAQAKAERQERVFNFKQGVKQKATSAFSRLGTMKNALVEKIRNVKDKVVDFGTTQVANYYLKKEEKEKVKAFREASKLAEKQELMKQKERIKERKSAMKAALNSQEREMYEQKHIENMARREELIASIFGGNTFDEPAVAVRAL